LRGAPVAKNDKQKSRWTKLLLKDGVHKIIAQARAQASGKPCQAAVEKELHSLDHNAGRMLYGTYREAGLFIGSGVIEAGCKTVIGARCKQSGMFWSRPGAGNILALRCLKSGNTWETFWKTRANTPSALNDSLPWPPNEDFCPAPAPPKHGRPGRQRYLPVQRDLSRQKTPMCAGRVCACRERPVFIRGFSLWAPL